LGIIKENFIEKNSPIFVISDLHIGSGGKMDNFNSRKTNLLMHFLDYIEKTQGKLIIIGDLLELWHCGLDEILSFHKELFARLNQTDFTYILGNHDEELAEMTRNRQADLPILSRIKSPEIINIAGKNFKFMHGHEVDPFIRKKSKTICRVFNPILDVFGLGSNCDTLVYDIFSDIALEVGEAAIVIWSKLRELLKKAADDCWAAIPNEQVAFLKRFGRTKNMLKRYREDLNAGLYDIAIVGHTHNAGRADKWYYNSGSWTGHKSDYLCILPDGNIEVYNYSLNGPKPNDTLIR